MFARDPARSIARVIAALGCMLLLTSAGAGCARAQPAADSDLIPLPEVRRDGEVSVERALATRRSLRSYSQEGLSLEEVGQVLWSAQGATDRGRTAPSAGALYPIELYLVAGDVDELEPAVYRYHPAAHAVEPVVAGDLRARLREAALGQAWVGSPPAVLVVAGAVERTAAKYGSRAERYVLIEAGAVAENVYLQCESLGLATVLVGAFTDEAVNGVLALPEGEEAYVLMPLAHRPARDAR